MSGAGARTERWRYRLYGLTLASNRRLRDLPSGTAGSAPEIRVDFVGLERDPPVHANERVLVEYACGGETGQRCGSRLSMWDDLTGNHVSLYYFGEGDEVVFRINPARDHIRVYWTDAAVAADVETLLSGPVLAALLRLRGLHCLHASAITLNGWALAIVGSSGAGKSTTAAALTAHGFSVLSDDVGLLREDHGAFSVVPAEPRLRLWPDAARAANLADADAPRVLSGSPKRFAAVPVRGRGRARSRYGSPVPLAAIYLLDRDAASDAAIRIEPIRGAAAIVALTSQLYAGLLSDEARAGEFAFIGRLAATVPLRRVRRPRALQRLAALARCIAEDAHHLHAGAARTGAGIAAATASTSGDGAPFL
jgi:hypothetical protein